MRRHRFVATALLLSLGSMLIGHAAAQDAAPPQTPRTDPQPAPRSDAEAEQPTLFERLGGTYAVAGIVDEFVERMISNPVVAQNRAVMRTVEPGHVPGLKFQITAFVINAAGGPYRYHGQSMLDAHRGMQITDDQWNAAMAELRAVLARRQVPEPEQKELVALLESTRDRIVMAD